MKQNIMLNQQQNMAALDGESMPSYVVATEMNNGTYNLDITPVKKSHIASC